MRPTLLRGLFLAAALLPAAVNRAADEPVTKASVSSLPRIGAAIHDALQSREFARAVKLIDAESAKAGAPVDYLLYLKGRALIEAGKLDEAVAAFTAIEEKHPDSEWVSRARFGRADVLVRARNYQAAGQIYKAEAERLLSRDRKDELAKIYLEFADRYFDGVPAKDPAQTLHPDFQQALTYYQEVLKLGVTSSLQQRVEFRIARCLQQLNNPGEAIAAYQRLLAKADPKAIAKVELPKEVVAEAKYQLGASQLAAGQPAEARRTWQDFLAVPSDEATVRKFRVLASSRLPETYGFPQPGSVGDLELGLTAVARFLKEFPAEEQAPRLELDAARALTHHSRFDEAVERLKLLIANKRYGESKVLPDARQLLGQALRAQAKFDEAIAAWKDFLELYPTDPKWSEVQQAIVDTEFAKADDQREQGLYDEARKQWETFLNKYPLDPRAPQILFQFGSMKQAAALQKLKDAKEKTDKLPDDVRSLFDEAIRDWRRVVQKYPGSGEASQAQLLIAVTLEEQLGQLKESLEAYRQVQGPQQPAAVARIAHLTEAQLEVRTERKFHSDEKPRVKVAARNIEKVVLKIYQVDLADYFRKMHLARGVEALDVSLIDPDKSVDHPVANYEPFRRIEDDVELPLEGPGVWAVTVASDKLEATTMVVVSDLDVIVKASRNELLVFAEDTRQGKAWEGVSVLVSDQGSVFAEETTGKDGLLQKSFDQLKSIEDLRVFAVRDGHVASTVTSLNGLDFAVGLSPRGYLYTDRPAYKAGQLVNVKGIVRWVDGDRLTFKPDEQFTLEIFDSRGRSLQSQVVKLNEFGTVVSSLMLPATSPQGDYRVHLHQPQLANGQSYETQFKVVEYRLDPLQLTVNVAERVAYRGEKIKGTIKLAYYYGAPAAGKAIQYHVGGDGAWTTATTDAKGEVTFEHETQQFSESQAVPITVQYPERNLGASETVFVAARGFDITVESLRDVYVNGETFDITARVRDAAGEPVATKLALQVYEQPKASDRPLKRSERGERLVSTIDIESTKEKGEVRRTLRLDRGGRYTIRVTGTDRFGNRISGQKELFISGQEDETRLRVLADQYHYTVGETAEITLHWREPSALALVTYDGANILGHQLVRLETGVNKIKVAMGNELAPNFVLSAAVMQGHKLHSAGSAIEVARKLEIRLKPSKDVLKPGEDAMVEIETLDAQGRPTSVELSLAMVQANLLNRFSPVQGPIDGFFGTGHRTIAMRQSTSCDFSYAPATAGISQFLLADAERLAREAREKSAMPELAKELAGADRQLDGVSAFDAPASGEMGGMGGGFGMPAGATATGGSEVAARYNKLLGADAKWAAGRRKSGGDRDRFDLGDVNGNGVLNVNDFSDAFFEYKAAISSPDAAWAYVGQSSRYRFNVNGQTRAGVFLALNGRSEQEIRELVESEGLQVLPALSESETGFWNPRILTDETGKAKIAITMPERSTAWKLNAVGITSESLAGQAEVALTTRKDVFGEMRLPLAFTAGDKANILAEIHSSLEGKHEIKATFKATLEDKTVELTKTVVLDGAGVAEMSFPADLSSVSNASEDARFELTVATGDQTDRTSQSVPVLPYGLPAFGSSSGSASQSTIAFVGFPENQAATRSGMEIVIGPSVHRSLVDSVLDSQPVLLLRCGLPPISGIERATSGVLGGVAVMKLIGASRNSDTPDAVAISGRVTSGIASLVSGQRDDGGWSWTGRADAAADRFLTSRAVWALAEARRSGFAVPNDAVERAVGFLNTALTQTAATERETQAVLLHGLAAIGRADFSLANRLHRERNSLSASGLLNVALALIALDRKEMVNDLLPLIDERVPAAAKAVNERQSMPWLQNAAELQALQLLALAEVRPADAALPKLVESILAARVGARWPVEKANGPILQALATWFARTKPAAEKYTLTVFVNDRHIEKLEFDGTPGSARHVAVPVDALVDGKPQKINFDLQGRGTFSYSAVLTGFVPADKAASTTNDWRVARSYEPAPRMFDGLPVPRGFGALNGPFTAFSNPLTQLPLAERGDVAVSVWRNYDLSGPEEKYPYLVISEPVPAGCQVVTDSITGDFERYELGRGEITFFFGDRRYGSVRYSLVGDLPGTYKIGPTAVRNFYNPSQVVIAGATALDVLERGVKSKDEYKLTPDELFYYGQKKLAKGDFAGAHESFSQLFGYPVRLNDNVYRETVQSLFRTSVVVGKHSEIVKFFEIIKEKFPDIEIGFEDILTVASSYRELGEYERSYLVYRATIESGFERETRTAGFLETHGELLKSVQVLEKLLRDYPAEGYIASATYALAQEVYRHAGDASVDPKLRAAGLTRVHLISQAILMLDHFLSTWPNDPADDQASFALANALLDLEQYQTAIDRAEKFAQRYPQSRMLDSFWYTIGFSRFMLGQPEQALEMCRKVAEAKFPVPETGGTRDAENKWEAIYIMGQVFHSLGKAADAIAEYTRVKDRFADAAEAITEFTRKSISVPEVTTIHPADEKKLTIKFRNLPEVSIKVYRIDLLKFSLLHRSFDHLTSINLAGIRPYHEETVKLGDGKDYKDREQTITLPLKEEGAYLVVGRGEDLYASGLVLVSPLAIEPQEDSVSGRVRVTVKDDVEKDYASKVHVKVIGSSNPEFISGETDLRGLFIADGIRGTSTVIAMAEPGRYAFYRGTHQLGPQDTPPAPAAVPADAIEAPQAPAQSLRSHMSEQNSQIQMQNRGAYEHLLNNSTEGVKAEKAY
jgi:uncharacterized protein YfaS (alpha-2-macroglobulin family)/tetratricopeptide (TPR) repeat protein